MNPSPLSEKSDHTNKGAWTEDEDRRLTAYIQSHGTDCWASAPKAAGLLRSDKSCCLRWLSYLNPATKRVNFTDEEEGLIIKFHSFFGNRWSAIAGRLPGRTDNEVRDYWNSHISKKLSERGIDPLTHRPMRTISLFPTESIGEKEEESKMNTPDGDGDGDGSISNDEDLSDIQFFSLKSSIDSKELDLLPPGDLEVAADYYPLESLLDFSWPEVDDTYGCSLSIGIPPSSPIPKDLQNEDNVVIQLDSDSDATHNKRNVLAIGESNTNDTGGEQSNSTTCVTSSLDNKTRVPKVPDADYITTKICISLEVLKQHFGMNMDDAAKSLRVSRSSLKRICRENGIERWPCRKRKKINRRQSSNLKNVNKLVRDSNEEITQSTRGESSSPKDVTTVSPLGDASSSSVTIKATCGDDIIKFQVSLSSGMDDLREKVAKRLGLELGSFKLKHKDDAGDLVLINCDEDLHDCFGRLSRSVDHITTIDMLVFPVTNQSVLHAPLSV